MDTKLRFVHDANVNTFPIQSERHFKLLVKCKTLATYDPIQMTAMFTTPNKSVTSYL